MSVATHPTAPGVIDQRKKNYLWNVTTDDGRLCQDGAIVAVLMDIRDELRTMNSILTCPNFTNIPNTLRSIESNTKKPRKRKKRA
jgi:hypothetical protein